MNKLDTHTHSKSNKRPKLSIFWLIFWGLFGLVPAIIYYLWKKGQQEEWDRENR